MILLLSIVMLIAAFAVLMALAVIDLRRGLLPDKLNAALAALGVSYHAVNGFGIMPPVDMITGAAIGGGMLWAVRIAAHYCYRPESLGLGDVKLLAAAGIWLGPHSILMAIVLGALAGMAHGFALALSRKIKNPSEKISLTDLSLPAGPGFIAGIIIVGVIKLV